VKGAVVQAPGVATAADLREQGFEGFVTFSALRADGAASVPVAPGVWVVVHEPVALPHFLPRSTAPAWRGQEPTLPPDALAARWVPHACVLYVGVAPGAGVRHLLRQQVKRFLRFGDGRNVAHWGGRAIWQLAGAGSLRVAWRVAPPDGVRAAAAGLLRAFEEHHGMRPFANEPEEDEA